MQSAALLLGLVLGGPSAAPECGNAPSRTSEFYWDYIEACGCQNLEAPSSASSDYERFLNACSRWRQRNPEVGVVGTKGTPADARRPECGNPPSRTSESYWLYLETCGCSKLDPPSRASSDYERFMKACGQWRQQNPEINAVDPAPKPSPSDKPKPTPSPAPSPEPKPRPGS